MTAFGALIAVLAAVPVVNRSIERGVVSADRWRIGAVTILLVALTAAMMFSVAGASSP